MHEISLALEIQRIARAAAGRHDGRIEAVTVSVGELTAVEPCLLEYAWEAVTAGGPDAGSRLHVEWRPARQICAVCGVLAEHAPGSWLRICPGCGGVVRVEGGADLDVLRVSFVPAGEAA